MRTVHSMSDKFSALLRLPGRNCALLSGYGIPVLLPRHNQTSEEPDKARIENRITRTV